MTMHPTAAIDAPAQTPPEAPWRPRILTALAGWAQRSPAATAVHAPDGELTFAELHARTRTIAAALHEAGTGRADPVGLCLGRTRDSVAALLAAWYVGATAVPVDERHPADRVSFVLRDAGVRLLVGDRLPAGGAPPKSRILTLAAGTTEPSEVSGLGPVPDDCAYLIYTSGTTGWPKGVEVTYRNLDAFLSALSSLALPAGGLGINAVSPAFDGWLWCTLLYLLHGQGVAIVDPSVESLGEQLHRIRPRTVSLTPSLLATCDGELAGVEVLVVAGEPCPPALVERFGGGRRMLNVYGPTEATIAATWADSARGDDPRTIGRPLPGYRGYVLDERGEPVTGDAPGELYVGGPAVAVGYRNRPELTRERFLDDPFAGGGRMYRTGDLVLTRPDGQLEYLGRVDDQVKVRGYRVELAEIERVATRLPQVRTAAAYTLPAGDAIGLAIVPETGAIAPETGAELGAGTVTAAGVDGAGGDLAALVRDHCARHLPEVMRPGTVELRDSLPVSPTGKVDRAALARDAGSAAVTGRAPRTERERELCQMWSELLDRPVRDVDADFFALGGHSLLAARAVSLVRRRTGLRLSMRHLLAHPTVAGLAAELDKLASGTNTSASRTDTSASRTDANASETDSSASGTDANASRTDSSASGTDASTSRADAGTGGTGAR